MSGRDSSGEVVPAPALIPCLFFQVFPARVIPSSGIELNFCRRSSLGSALALSPFQEAHTARPFSLFCRWPRSLGSGIMAFLSTPTGTGPGRSRRRRTNPSTCSRSSESSKGWGSAWSSQNPKSHIPGASSVTPGLGEGGLCWNGGSQ